jgi:hypothetical protein
MAVWEKVGRTGADATDKSQDEYIFEVTEADTQDEVASQLNAALPATVGILKRTSYGYKEMKPGRWEATVRYVTSDHPERKDNNNQPSQPAAPVRLNTPAKWSRACQLSTVRVNISLGGNAYPATQPHFNGLIEVDSNNVAKGTDRFAMAKEWQLEKCIAYGSFTTAWLDAIDALDLSLNQGTFYWMEARSALFLGATLVPEEASMRVILRFLHGKNETSLSIAGISVTSKGAHDYLWAYYQDEIVDDKHYIPRAKAIFVDKLYPDAAWSALETFIGIDAVGGPS